MRSETMENEVYSFALKSTLDELQKICPNVKNALFFTQDGIALAANENTPKETAGKAKEALWSILEKSQPIGNVEKLVLEGINANVKVSLVDRFYFVAVTAKEAEADRSDNIANAMVTSVLKVIDKFIPAPSSAAASEVGTGLERTEEEKAIEPQSEPVDETTGGSEEKPSEKEAEAVLPEAPVNQLIVEDLKGLLAPSDTVRVDESMIQQWNELFEGRDIAEADIETFGGQSVRCKVGQIKNSKLEGQGKIQIPARVQQSLEVKKGELVRIKPVVE